MANSILQPVSIDVILRPRRSRGCHDKTHTKIFNYKAKSILFFSLPYLKDTKLWSVFNAERVGCHGG